MSSDLCITCKYPKLTDFDRCIQCGSQFILKEGQPLNVELQRDCSTRIEIQLPTGKTWDDVVQADWVYRQDELLLSFNDNTARTYNTATRHQDFESNGCDDRMVIYDDNYEDLWRSD